MGIPGSAPAPGARPSGCAYAPRCELAVARCRQEAPPLEEARAGHRARCFRAGDTAKLPTLGAAPVRVDLGSELVRAEAVRAAYAGTTVVHDVTLDVRAGECLALVGESGSGKTTVARCIAGLHADYTGTVLLHGTALPPAVRHRSSVARREIQYIFQNPYASLNPRRTVAASVLVPRRLFFGQRGERGREAVRHYLERVSLPASVGGRFPDQLSGGELQRVAIARALAAEPSVLVCDEVTSALDVSVQAAIVDLLVELRATMGLSLIFITHNLALVRTIADRVAVMNAGKIIEHGDADLVLDAPREAYTISLLGHTPSVSRPGPVQARA